MKIMIAKVYDSILEEEKVKLVIEKAGKLHVGALMFPIEKWEKISSVMQEIDLEENAADKEIVDTACSLLKENKMLAKDGKTVHVLYHWGYENSVLNECNIDIYCNPDKYMIYND